jgi:hypothetical protein
VTIIADDVAARGSGAASRGGGAIDGRARLLLWVGLSFGAALALAAAVLVATDATDDGIHLALLSTARFMFLLFWLAYAGSALASLFGSHFEPVRRRARAFGLAFAAALAVHLGLVAWLCLSGDIPPVKTFLVFGAAALCVCLLTACSLERMRNLLGAKGWALLRFLGMNYVACAFAADFLRNPLAGDIGHALFYWAFMALAIIGPGLRVAAAIKAFHAGARRR